MADTPILGLPDSFPSGQFWTEPIATMVIGALETQAMAALQILVAEYPDGGVLEIPDDTAWAVSNAGVISPGAGIATHSTYKAIALQTTSNTTIDDTTAGFVADSTGLYLFATIETSTNDSRKTGIPKFVLSDSETMNGGILIASDVATDADSVTAATDAREFIEFGGTTGSGDMTKAVYDTDNDGKVDSAEVADSVPWSGITDKPATFPADTHTHSNATTAAAGFLSASDKLKLDNATASATASTLALRDPSGRLAVATPSATTDAANKAYVDATAASGAADASDSVKGITQLSVAPVDSATPIAVGDNDPRVSDFGASGTNHKSGLVPDPGVTEGSTRFLREDGVWVSPAAGMTEVKQFQLVSDAPGDPIAADTKVRMYFPYACTITAGTLGADNAGNIVIDIWKDTTANYPPTDADSITASAPLTLSAAASSHDSTLTGWSTAIAAGTWLVFNVDECSGIEEITVALTIVRA